MRALPAEKTEALPIPPLPYSHIYVYDSSKYIFLLIVVPTPGVLITCIQRNRPSPPGLNQETTGRQSHYTREERDTDRVSYSSRSSDTREGRRRLMCRRRITQRTGSTTDPAKTVELKRNAASTPSACLVNCPSRNPRAPPHSNRRSADMVVMRLTVVTPAMITLRQIASEPTSCHGLPLHSRFQPQNATMIGIPYAPYPHTKKRADARTAPTRPPAFKTSSGRRLEFG